jgi:cytochrome c
VTLHARAIAPLYVGAAAMAALTLSALGLSPARSEELAPDAQAGLTIVRADCSRCHAIGPTGDSPLRDAPAFRTLHSRYPVEALEESLAEGTITGHPAMPEFQFSPEQVADIIAYLKSLER